MKVFSFLVDKPVLNAYLCISCVLLFENHWSNKCTRSFNVNVFYWFTEMTSDANFRIVHTDSENEALAYGIFTVCSNLGKDH